MAANNRTALVVGASRGLGLGLAAELQRRGWSVVATVREAAGERRLQALAAARPRRVASKGACALVNSGGCNESGRT